MAKNTGAIRHVHKYYKEYDPKGRFRWACLRDGCTHFIPRNTGTPAGKMSICWDCEKEYMLIPYLMERDHPFCDECAERVDAAERYAEEKLKQIPQMNFMEQMRAKQAKLNAERAAQEKDQIEVIEPEDK